LSGEAACVRKSNSSVTEKLIKLIETNPLMTDGEIAGALGVSLSTVRLDRGLLSIPELRERMRSMAETRDQQAEIDEIRRSFRRAAGTGA
jgi:hypothetical protein